MSAVSRRRSVRSSACSLTDGSPARDARSVMADMRQQADHFLRIFVPGPDDAGAGPSSAAGAMSLLAEALLRLACA